jgi:DnaJ-class molecular chaperone
MLHPDKNGNTPEATDTFQKMQAAYETLKAYLSNQKGGSNRQKYRKTKKTQKLRHKKHHRKTHRVRV